MQLERKRKLHLWKSVLTFCNFIRSHW